MPMPERPLAGVTVVELGHSVAAPYAGLILAELGARVIKVENPKGGDYARGWGPPFWEGVATSFLCFNRGKEGIAIDFTRSDHAQALRSLIIEEADAVIQNLRPGILEKFDLTSGALRAEKPALIWCDIGAFGARGPLAQKPGYDPLAQAATGIMSVTGEGGDRPPVRVGVSLIDMGSGMWTVIGLLASLLARHATGEGTHVFTSLYETGLAWMTVPLAGYEANGGVRPPYGSGTAEIVPYQAFQASDGWLMIAAGNDNLFRKLCGALGLAELSASPESATNEARVRNRDRVVARIGAAVAGFTVEGLAKTLDDAGVPNSPLLTVDQVARHPQAAAVGMLAPCEDDNLRLTGIPLTLNGTRPRSHTRAPKLGEHDVRWLKQSKDDPVA
ncbi:MAG TPA: CoA transferase [Hyphomicrobiaceae bacterium]|jgi:crotonobetainyl-CoA:carnitine CoA-transferase CaiB-like acyl-CoA transferase|nr:CoA transferase [Hyphomicrobiaceae bacterium]